MQPGKRALYIGVALAVLATIMWSGNFIVARGVFRDIPPVSLNFYRWLTASICISPFAWKNFNAERHLVMKHRQYLFWVALTGITLFNTFVYIAGHYTTAINMVLIGTTTSPVFAILLARIFLKEQIGLLRIIGLGICITGIIFLLSDGSIHRLITFKFSTGDWWMLCGALFFAIYTTMVKRKPQGISPLNFLFVCFWLGTLMLLPFYAWELAYSAPVPWDGKLVATIVYLGAGASAIAYLCWNAAIARLGSSRTALFSNLIPIFSTVEAVMILNERIKTVHIVSGVLVICGLVIANLKKTG